MKKVKSLLRLIYINHVLMRHGLDEMILATRVFAPLRFLRLFNPHHWWRDKSQSRGMRIRLALEDLGPIFVKFGQILSTRRDLLPDDIADELAKLQDQVPPFSAAAAIKVIEKAYGRPVDEVFAEFDETPLASASIAQVHTAQLSGGKNVVVKILRPNIKKTIRHDVDLLFLLARLAERYWSEGPRLRPVAVIAEFEQTLLDELDLMREAANASQLRRNFLNSKDLYVPEIHWDYARHRVMVMERIHGVPIANIAALREAKTNLKKLAERGVEIFFTQVFRDRFFHADMHPGNIFVDVNNPDDPRYIAIDFGIVGTLSTNDQRYLAENFLAFFQRDYRRVAELHVQSGWVPAETRVDAFESAIRTVCEPIFDRPLRDISFGQTLLRLFQTARRFNMEVQPQLVLLQKTLLNIEGLGRTLYPDLDLWTTAKPFLEKWLRQQVGPKAFYRKARDNMPELLEKLPELPMLLHDTLQSLQQSTRNNHNHVDNILQQKQHQQKHRRGVWQGLSLAFLLGAAVIVVPEASYLTGLADVQGAVWLLAGLGAVTGLIGFNKT